MVRLCTRPAIERAATETPHLQRGAPDFYPSGPDFWCAFEDGEVKVIGDEPGNTDNDPDPSEKAVS